MNLSQLFMVGLPADNDLSFVREFKPGGVILMGRNARPFDEIAQLSRQLAEAVENIIIASDHEGGRVQRLKEGFEVLPPARDVASLGVDNVRQVAERVAKEFKGAGLNLNFAPVCDVPTHQGDTVIGKRAFSTNFDEAGQFAAAYIEGLQGESRVGACAKHFPGHGGVGVDSHFGMPTFFGQRDELEPHLKPFRASIQAGVSAIMVAHIAVPEIDPSGAPASLSHPLISGVLREELGFDGLIVSDDLEMGALETISPGAIAVRALNAGCDFLLFCHSSQKAIEARDAVEKALSDGRLEPARVAEALSRIVAWRRAFAAVTQS
ncbi:beta-N-acetylhexosaminidase [bacterium]|nr:MAG: beta-N-acetylhexosaminidase [bacterium]